MNGTIRKPMRVIDIQRGVRQLGRIRLGTKTADGNPQKLSTFRLTSNDGGALEKAAAIFGGKVQPWKGGTERFELITERHEMRVVVVEGAETSYELWGAKQGQGVVCLKRCDGCTIVGGRDFQEGTECQCHPDPKERAGLAKQKGSDQCRLITRLRVRIPELPDFGFWRVDTHGFYAATEMPSASDGLALLVEAGVKVETMLAIEIRKAGNKRFPVPVLRMNATMDEVKELIGVTDLASLGRGGETAREVLAALPAIRNGLANALPARSGQGDGDFNDEPA